jgi:hypothetical protein
VVTALAECALPQITGFVRALSPSKSTTPAALTLRTYLIAVLLLEGKAKSNATDLAVDLLFQTVTTCEDPSNVSVSHVVAVADSLVGAAIVVAVVCRSCCGC